MSAKITIPSAAPQPANAKTQTTKYTAQHSGN
jgi:hypothetical protein